VRVVGSKNGAAWQTYNRSHCSFVDFSLVAGILTLSTWEQLGATEIVLLHRLLV